jgi:hypothetical protein
MNPPDLPDDLPDDIPDIRDGLTRKDRIVLYLLAQTQKERRREAISTAELYGRVLEHIDISQQELHAILRRLGVSTAL